jgi:hypothetical protein
VNIALVIILAICTEGRYRFVVVDAVKAAIWLRGSVSFLPEFCSLFIRFGKNKFRYKKCPQKIVWSCVGKWCSANGTLFRDVSEVHCVLPTCECFPIWVKCCAKNFNVFSEFVTTFL